MPYTQIKIKQIYREKLSKLAASQNRSMANMIEVLIDQALSDKEGEDDGTNTPR